MTKLCVCVKLLYAKFVCVCEVIVCQIVCVCVKLLYVKFVCVKLLYVRDGM